MVRICRRLAFTAFAATALVNVLFTWAVSGRSDDELILRDWLATHASPSHSIAEFEGLPITYRRAIYSSASPAEKAALWREHFRLLSERDAVPSGLLERAMAIADAKKTYLDPTLGQRDELDRLAKDFTEALGPTKTKEWLASIGSTSQAKAPRPSTVVRLRLLLRHSLIAEASAPDWCNCTNDSSVTMCTDPMTCEQPSFCMDVKENCGWMWDYTCNGLCVGNHE